MVEQFILTVDGTPYSIEIKGNQVTVNGYPLTLNMEEDVIQINGMARAVELVGNQAIVDGIAYAFEVEWPTDEPDTLATKSTKQAEYAASEGAVKAIMPGKVVRLLVQEGAEVKKGQVVAILEAMKMENELNAPRDGVVKEVLVAVGANVEQGQPLMDIQ